MKLHLLFLDLLVILRFVINKYGREYGISRLKRLKLAIKIIQNSKKIKSLTNWKQHIYLAQGIFTVPKSLKGDVVECGCYEGASATNLSLACALTDRRLIICDSFEGLPNPKDNEKHDIHADHYYVWEKGEFAPEKGLDGVKENLEKFGNIEVCQFVKGYFKDTLKAIDTDSIVLIFEDVDMRSSVEDCLRYLWPKLQEGCRFFCHEPWSINVVSLFFDKTWWKEKLNTHPPGFYGSGRGIFPYDVGYAEKFDAEKIKENGKR
jgi:O-methyltransferase